MARITGGVFPGPAGDLEYILNEAGDGSAAGRAAVVCHPHPLFGGTLHTRIVFHTARALAAMGAPVLRFNFRGVGRSGGAHDRGAGEQEDLRAAMAFMRQRYPAPLLLAGFSFGATVVARLLAAAAHSEVAQAVLLGLPVDNVRVPQRWAWSGPTLMISGDHDQYASVAGLEAYYAGLAAPKARRWIAGGDHFLSGHMEEFREALQTELRRQRR
ncbi:MAG: alpha/beta hydrolase [Terriglobales bacterium]